MKSKTSAPISGDAPQLQLFSLKTRSVGAVNRVATPICRESIEASLGIITAKTWPPRYKVHKYWGRKPANVVSEYVKFFSTVGDTILDPFSGSGVTIVESQRCDRIGIGFDVNPFAVRLAKAMLSPPSATDFEKFAHSVLHEARNATGHLFTCLCEKCGSVATLRSAGYDGEKMREIRYKCPSCRYSGSREPTAADLDLAKETVPCEFPDADVVFGWEMQKLKRRNIKRWSELFTLRNLAAVAHLRTAIDRVDDARCKEWMLLSLTAGLAQFSRMIADSSEQGGGPSWKINCYWLPKRWQELNPLWYFENRISKSLGSIKDLLLERQAKNNSFVVNADSRCMDLSNESIDYIFTDPPYGGEGIQYGELTALWCVWLGECQDLASEIAFNPYRKFDQAHYAEGLRKVFAECFRVLKTGKYMTVAFANKDPAVWDALMDACRSSGFSLMTVAPLKRSAPSLTEKTMHTAPKTDLLLTFEKPSNLVDNVKGPEATNYSIAAAVQRIIRSSVSLLTVHEIFDGVTIDWFTWYYANGVRDVVVQPTLANVEIEVSKYEVARLSHDSASK